MKERPILFSGSMVRALVAGTKTQTRRLVDVRAPMDYIGPSGFLNDPECWGYQAEDGHWYVLARGKNERFPHGMISISCPHGEVGDRLWVRETWQAWMAGVSEYDDGDPLSAALLREGVPACFEYLAGPTESLGPWRPSIHMPRRASRIDLEIVEVRVQRLQDITEEDARAEGFDEWIPCNVITGLKGVRVGGAHRQATCREHFSLVWDAINGKRASWESNPWCWTITFKRVRP